MKVEHVKGNTWTLIDWEYIPFYKVDDSHCILLDTGTHEQREDLENTLNGLTTSSITQAQINQACEDFKSARQNWLYFLY